MKLKLSYIICAVLVPLVMMITLALLVSVLQFKQDVALSAKTLLRFSEDVSTASWRVTGQAVKLADRPCAEILSELNRTRAFTPYIRDIGLLEKGNLLCSFVSREQAHPFPLPPGKTLPTPLPARWVRSFSWMAGGPGRPAVVYTQQVAADKAAFVIVDSRYVQELMDVLSEEREAVFSLRFGKGDAIISQPAQYDRIVMTQNYVTDDGKISLTVAAPLGTLTAVWMKSLLIFIPLSFCFSFLTLVLYRHWSKMRMSMAREIIRGMKNAQFTVHYQPVFNVNRGNCGGVEALMRWPLPDGRFITPDIFITAAENEGMIVPLSRHLFKLIAEDVERWQVAEGFYISVNISPEHLVHESFIEDVELLQARLGNLRLMLELTERSLIVQPALVSDKLIRLREKGILIAIDDFGTGYCSLSYLQQLPVDYLKIDRTFVDTIDTSGSDVPILDTIIMLSHKLGLNIVAEGVSSEHQLNYILDHNVGFIQGYLYAKPMCSSDFTRWLDTRANEQNDRIKCKKCSINQ
ncbi:EAL domain-containing protein [Klebsiella pneumoniae]|uniref:EAL domain-containing protein n=1 Tax=Klebsiella pneumoniae TaxID=573 RepID=UPI000808066E|nr:EAL domain-containing protein [Klebsiella pneumoniae]EIX9717022.1 EAL domain-containing protein [Klebsiella pneumoniae]EKT9444908.1 EAL domain-containing protein [Klebsiella pneumoniae]MBZ2001060.1 EAL domain-containing protein [Klebsiella pneumoniae]MCM6144419.1 EAL domain-containing protein [Klebsiella pneumoniae]MCQ8437481.1 EAL domain-containing protein [Klebsiella pneumoniae]